MKSFSRGAPSLIPVGVGLAGYALMMGYFAQANYAGEEVKDLLFAQAVMAGKGIYRDVDWIYGPLYPHFLAWFFRLTGLPFEVLTLRYLAVAAGSIAYLGSYFIARRFVSPGWSVLAAILSCTVFLPPGHTYNHQWTAAAVMLGIAALLRHTESPGRSQLVVLAITTSFALLTKPLPVGVGQFGVILAILIALGAFRHGPHRLPTAAAFAVLVLGLTGVVYGSVVANEGIDAVLRGLAPNTLRQERLSFHFLTPFLHPARLAEAWGWLVNGPRSPAQLVKAADHLLYTLDFFAIVVGAVVAFRLFRRRELDSAVPLAVLVITAYASDIEVIAYGRELLIGGTRAPALLLLIILALRWGGVGRDPALIRTTRGLLRVVLSAGVVAFTQLRFVLLRAAPMAVALVSDDPTSRMAGRFASELDITGFHGVRVMPETKAHFETVADEVQSRLIQGKTAATWGVPGMVSLLLGDRNLLGSSLHGGSGEALRSLAPPDRPDCVFLLEVLPAATADGCSLNLWPAGAELGYDLAADHCGKISRTYMSHFTAFERRPTP